MRGLAEFVMRGRVQALAVAVIGASTLMFSWVSAAVIALVTLRRGPGAGAYILAWAVLPAGFLLLTFGDSGPLAMLLGTMALALLLRWLASWPLVLMSSTAVGAITGIALLLFGGAFLEQLVGAFGADHVMWGSDFCQTHDRNYLELVGLAKSAFARLPLDDQHQCLAGTAMSLWPTLFEETG